MATTEDVQKLAALARIKVADTELERFTREFDAILAYVGQLEGFEITEEKGGSQRDGNIGSGTLHNVMREDGEPHAGGKYTEALVEAFPQKEGNALAVKQIITHE